MSDTFEVTLSARIRGRYEHAFKIKKSELYAWMKDYTEYDPYDEDNDWDDIINEYCEGYWDDLTDYPEGWDWDYSDEELQIEDNVDLTLKQPHEVQLHQEAKLW